MGWVSPQHEQTHGELTRYQAPLLIPLTLTTPPGDRCYNHSHFTDEQTRGGLTRCQAPLSTPLILTTPPRDRCYWHSYFTAADTEHREIKSLAQCHTAKNCQS